MEITSNYLLRQKKEGGREFIRGSGHAARRITQPEGTEASPGCLSDTNTEMPRGRGSLSLTATDPELLLGWASAPSAGQDPYACALGPLPRKTDRQTDRAPLRPPAGPLPQPGADQPHPCLHQHGPARCPRPSPSCSPFPPPPPSPCSSSSLLLSGLGPQTHCTQHASSCRAVWVPGAQGGPGSMCWPLQHGDPPVRSDHRRP